LQFRFSEIASAGFSGTNYKLQKLVWQSLGLPDLFRRPCWSQWPWHNLFKCCHVGYQFCCPCDPNVILSSKGPEEPRVQGTRRTIMYPVNMQRWVGEAKHIYHYLNSFDKNETGGNLDFVQNRKLT